MNEYLRQAMACMETATEGMDAERLQRHQPGKWSSADILEHLSLAFSSTSKVMARHLASHEPSQKRATWAERLRVLLVIEAGYFPPGRKAPVFTVPQSSNAEQALARFRQTMLQMDEDISHCEQEFGSGTKIASHPIFGPLTPRQWRRFHWLHTRHHARQVERLKSERAA